MLERAGCEQKHRALYKPLPPLQPTYVLRSNGGGMFRVRGFELTYEALNEKNTFSEGDAVSGRVTLTLARETKVKYLTVKLKGEARVTWSEGSGDHRRTYAAHRKYFKVREYLVAEDEKGTVLPPGVHELKFSMKFPDEGMPSSFKGEHGNIAYTLEAKMSRSWRIPSWDNKVLSFVSKSLAQQQEVMYPLTRTVNKEMGLFSKEQVRVSASVNRRVYSPGDTVSVVANIHNPSSKSVKPKFSLYQITVFRAACSSTSTDRILCKCVGNVTAKPEETVACNLKIPDDVFYSIKNCDILENSYYIKVYLDISFATDPEVLFPVDIVPAGFADFQGESVAGPYPAGAVCGPTYGDFPAPTFPAVPYPLPPGSGGYGCPAPYLAQSAITNQWAQQPPPPAATFPSSLAVLNQAPAAPLELLQGGGVPSHINPPSYDTVVSGTDHKI